MEVGGRKGWRRERERERERALSVLLRNGPILSYPN